MAHDVVNLHDFYRTPLGRAVQFALTQRIQSIAANLHNQTLLGLGYAVPLCEDLQHDTQHIIMCMPATMGVMHWPQHGKNTACLVDEYALPLPNECVDIALIVHTLEDAASPEDVMREVWRTLKPNGEVIVIAPKRSGAWAQRDTTPFGQGRPYSKSQLLQLLRGCHFNVVSCQESLYFPPFSLKYNIKCAPSIEQFGQTLRLPLGGIYVAHGIKQVYAPIAVKRTSNAVFRLKPQLSGQNI